MSAFEPFRQAVTAFFQAGFRKPAPTVGNPAATAEFLPVRYDNKPFKQPTDPWGSFSLRLGQREQLGITTRDFRTPGFATLQVYQKEEGGTKAAYEAADKMASFMDNASVPVPGVGTVLMRLTTHNTIGQTEQGLWQVNVTVNFQFDEVAGTP